MSTPLSHVQAVPIWKRRPTLGFLTYGPGDPNSYAVWAGVSSLARERDVNLICFPGRPVRSPLNFEVRANVLYDLASPECLDGLIIWVAGLTRWVEADEFRDFCLRYRPLPIVTVGGLVEGVPGVIVDNYHGMRDVVTHLAVAHHRTRIAFVRGPERHQEAEERYRAYRDVLQEAGLPFDPGLVVVGDFYESGGAQAADELLNRRHAHFDALAAASDDMAIGAMKTLQAHGIRVPDDLAIAGLNDNALSRVITPPLTTGPLYFHEQARRAAEMTLDLMAGQSVPERVVLPTRLIIRQSCGCPDPLIVQAAVSVDAAPAATFAAALAARRPLILAELFQAVEANAGEQSVGWAHQLLDASIADITQASSSNFLSALAEVLRQSAAVDDSISRWHNVISVLRRHLHPLLRETPEKRLHSENLWQQARVLIGETAQRARAYQAVQAEVQSQALENTNQMLSATIDMEELSDILCQALPKLGIRAFSLSLYQDPAAPAEWSHLVVAHESRREQALPPARRQRFRSQRLAPEDGLLSREERWSLVVEPLYFRGDQLGFMLFEADPAQQNMYDILRGEISGALKRTLVAAHNVELYNEAVQARQVAEEGRQMAEEGRRLAEAADRLKSRFLATVSHELRTPLSLIVGTMEILLRDETTTRPETLRSDLANVGASAQHLARLIGDVLDLASNQAGELRLTCEALNLGEVLQEAILLGEPIVREKGLTWKAQLPAALPRVWGDRTRLRQVVLNLISNAAKFTQAGEVELRVDVTDTTVTVSVRDTGIGIPGDELGVIFDEFRQTERTRRRGYGGMGLGLAISRRLIELHAGRIGVQSPGQEGAGSTFFFTLPLLATAGAQPTPTNLTQTVVLLTQHAGGAARLMSHLAQRGFQVQERAVDDQPDWLEGIMAAPPGAVVLDWKPADERGWDLMRLLKQNPATQDVPVVFYSLSDSQNCGAMLELDLLAKPLSAADLALALDRQGFRTECTSARTILIADDDPAILDMHARLVQARLADCRILKAHDGREALDWLKHTRPDLVLLDLMMPEVDGFHVLEAMRTQDLGRDVPVIVLTARILTRADMTRLQQGVTAVMGKGLFSVSEVLAQVEGALARSKRLGGDSQRIVRQVMAYIHEHYAEPLSLNDLTRLVCLSERHLNRCFQQELGVTAMTYLNRYRVRQARTLLEQGKTLVQVALAVGYADRNYFGRVFRKEVGVSPRAYQLGKRPALPNH